MLPLVSRRNARCSGGATAGSPSAKNLIVCGLPASLISKSPAVNPLIGLPCLSVTTTPKWTRSTAVRNVCCAAESLAAAIATIVTMKIETARDMKALGTMLFWRLKHFVPTDANDLGTERPVGVDAAEPVTPLNREECSEKRRRLDRAAHASVVSQSGSEPWIVHDRRVEETIHPDQPAHPVCDGRSDHTSLIVANQGRW